MPYLAVCRHCPLVLGPVENLDGTILLQHAAVDNDTGASTHGEDRVDARQRVWIKLHIVDWHRTELGLFWALQQLVGQDPGA